MSSTDIYATPEADLSNARHGDRSGGNIDDAIAGNIEIGMLQTLGEAWRGMKGFKLKCHIALVLYFIVYLLAVLLSIPVIFGLTAIGAEPQTATLVGSLVQICAIIGTMPMIFGVFIMAMRHANDKSISTGSIFDYFSSIPPLFFAYILQTLLIVIGLILLVLPGIYLAFAYLFAMPLIVEKKMGVWQALETSRKAVTRIWFRLFGAVMLLSLINTLGVFTLGIAWIWTLPWSVLALAMVYVKLFGAEAHTLAE